jgi:hypothetical protein
MFSNLAKCVRSQCNNLDEYEHYGFKILTVPDPAWFFAPGVVTGAAACAATGAAGRRRAIARGAPRAYFRAMIQFLDTVLYILLAVVFLVLAAGIYSLFRGGEFSRTWSNKLMRARVLFQFIAILVVLAGFWLKQHLGA